MEKRDYILTMIEQLGMFIKNLLSDLIKDVGTENIEKTLDSIEDLFAKEFKITIDELILLPETDFNDFIKNINLKEMHLENFSELLFQISLQNIENIEKAKLLKEKALLLLNLADSISNSYSIERISKKNIILNS